MKKGTLQCCLSGAWGGLEMVAFDTAVKMSRDGHAITTICPPGSPLQNKLVEAGLPTIGVVRNNKYFAPSAIRTIRRALKTGAFSSVLVQQTNDLWQIVPALFGMKNIRLIAVSHSFLAISKRDFLHSVLYGRLNHLIALTEIHKRNLAEKLPIQAGAIEVLPNSVDLEKFSPKNRSDDIRKQYLKSPDEMMIGVVSRLDAGKGLMETLRTAEIMRDWNMKFQIVIFGRETLGQSGFKEALEEEISARRLRHYVQLAGHRPDIERVMASLDVLLMPSPAETFGRVLIEAMASGVPVVASSGGGVSNIVEHEVNGLLVKPLNSAEMADALRYYYDHPDKCRRIVQNGIRSASEIYDYRKVDQRLYGLLGV